MKDKLEAFIWSMFIIFKSITTSVIKSLAFVVIDIFIFIVIGMSLPSILKIDIIELGQTTWYIIFFVSMFLSGYVVHWFPINYKQNLEKIKNNK